MKPNLTLLIDINTSKRKHKDDADRNAGINIKRRVFEKEINEITEKYRYEKQKRHQELRKLYYKRNEKKDMRNGYKKIKKK